MRRPDGRVLLAGVARFVGLVFIAGIVACLGGLLLGALLHEGTRRGIAIGFYLIGSALAGVGVLIATRPPVKSKSTPRSGEKIDAPRVSETLNVFNGVFSSGPVRWASRDELREAMNVPALLVALGVTLIVIGAFVDIRH
jgi:hypothetical protein